MGYRAYTGESLREPLKRRWDGMNGTDGLDGKKIDSFHAKTGNGKSGIWWM